MITICRKRAAFREGEGDSPCPEAAAAATARACPAWAMQMTRLESEREHPSSSSSSSLSTSSRERGERRLHRDRNARPSSYLPTAMVAFVSIKKEDRAMWLMLCVLLRPQQHTHEPALTAVRPPSSHPRGRDDPAIGIPAMN